MLGAGPPVAFGVASPLPAVLLVGRPLNGAPLSDPSGRPARSAGAPRSTSVSGTGAGV